MYQYTYHAKGLFPGKEVIVFNEVLEKTVDNHCKLENRLYFDNQIATFSIFSRKLLTPDEIDKYKTMLEVELSKFYREVSVTY